MLTKDCTRKSEENQNGLIFANHDQKTQMNANDVELTTRWCMKCYIADQPRDIASKNKTRTYRAR